MDDPNTDKFAETLSFLAGRGYQFVRRYEEDGSSVWTVELKLKRGEHAFEIDRVLGKGPTWEAAYEKSFGHQPRALS